MNKFNFRSILVAVMILLFIPNILSAKGCSTKLFTATMNSEITIADAIENLADTCGFSIIVRDSAAKKRLNKRLYYVKLKNSTLRGFLDTILLENDLLYTLNRNKLIISYLQTKTFRIHYIAGKRVGSSKANVTIAGSSGGSSSDGGSGNGGNSETGISIQSDDTFQFWDNVEKEIQRILIGAGDGSTHYTKNGDEWTAPDGEKWEYNPLAPIVNPTAGMVTVTGTAKQLKRVEQYIKTLTKQIKSEVLIDVRILSVEFDNSKTTGVDWSQIYGLQNFTLNSMMMTQSNVANYTRDSGDGGGAFPFTGTTFADNPTPTRAGIFEVGATAGIKDLVKFLGTQGDVKSISSPRVLTLNNQPALISVGRELFYKIKSSATAASAGGATSSEGEQVSSVFAGILLDITPQIAPNGMVTLKINPSITDTAATITSDGTARNIPPDLIRRQIASVITVKDGQHAVLGGLISSKKGIKTSKVPLLGDLPLLEYMFKKEEKIEKVEELVLIITPHIIKSDKDISLKSLGYKKLTNE
ncbi:Type II secretion outermembrane pore forming protein (PulD) [hydrothermal vent metagenome]|uniref:Type II secretion outermembrane pore forming protein (PulD) n=1 Tax=hydrothermal vent metagenome TaxID=652676 RepID=A0A1W1EK65_9ZZZZ